MLGAAQEKVEAARRLRRESTPAERALWECLRDRRLKGVKFRRQHPLAGFVVDFFAPAHGLVVEVDGKIHDAMPDADREREHALRAVGAKVLRLSNQTILEDLPLALARVRMVLRALQPQA